MVEYIKKEKAIELVKNFCHGLIADNAQFDLVDDCILLCSGFDLISTVSKMEIDQSMTVKALEHDLEFIENKIITVEAQRDALLEELRKLGDCSNCKFNEPDAVDGCSSLMPCKDGSMWEWRGKDEN